MNPNALITADDWGMSPGINDGILELARKGIVKRVSCMAQGKYLHYRLDELLSLPSVELGLHFDLTFGKSKQEIRGLLFDGFFRRKRIKNQVLAAFRDQMARLHSLSIRPAYMDGHHHIHLIPGVLSAVVLEARFAGIQKVRTVWDPSLFVSKRFPLALLSLSASRLICSVGLETLPCWYPDLERIGVLRFRNKLSSLRQPTEVIVHPASRNDFAELKIPDSYSTQRLGEFRALLNLSSATY